MLLLLVNLFFGKRHTYVFSIKTTAVLTTGTSTRQLYYGHTPFAERTVRYRRGFDTDFFSNGAFDKFFLPSFYSAEPVESLAIPFGNLEWATYERK